MERLKKRQEPFWRPVPIATYAGSSWTLLVLSFLSSTGSMTGNGKEGKKPLPRNCGTWWTSAIFFGQCPCPNIRAGTIEAKTQFIERDGLKFGVRTIEDVERVARLCGAFPRLTNALFQADSMGALLKTAMGIHPSRSMPRFPTGSFPDWAKRYRLTVKSGNNPRRKVAYFAGCTGKHLFPEVPKAVVEVFQHNGFEVHFPDQKCCGMPPFLEGDRQVTLDFVRFNVEHLAEVVEEGYDVVCSCPTCSYMLRTVLGEGAYFSKEYQDLVGGDEKSIRVPAKKALGDHGDRKLELFSKMIYKGIFKDDGYFSSVSPLKRIKVAENTYDLGEYLSYLHQKGELSTDFGPVQGRMAYYPPCHLREQEIGQPYVDLLKRIPGMTLEVISGAFYCCGLAGVMGFKREYHESSMQLGSPLMEKIRTMNPETILTDCLSCRLQFNQLLPYHVVHPIEVLKESYAGAKGNQSKATSTAK